MAEQIAESLGLWFTVFAIVISCILVGIWIYIIYVDDTTRTVADIVAKTSAMNAKGKCGIVFIDYLGLIRFDGKQPLYIQISEVTKSMKRLAKDCRCPVVLLCQLNRNSVRDGRPPDLQDLRDSGSIEQMLMLFSSLRG